MSAKTIWSFLGYEEIRKPEKTAMKVKHIDDVPASKITFPVSGQIKKDGVYLLVVKKQDGETAMFSRTGKLFQNLDALSLEFGRTPSQLGVYIAELCNNGCSLEALSGMVNPNRTKGLNEAMVSLMKGCYMVFHDYLTIDEFFNGESTVTYSNRLQRLDQNLYEYYRISKTVTIYSMEDILSYADSVIANDEEGVVLKPEEGWLAGHKGYRMMKIVRGVDYDLECVGVEEGTGKYAGKVANLVFKWKDGETISCMLGKGWTHDDAEVMWAERFNAMHTPVGKVFHVHALQESSKGKLRLPKVGEQRIDKTVADI